MKLKIGMWDVNITATSEIVYADEDLSTKHFLNQLYLNLQDAGNNQEEYGYPATAAETFNMAEDIVTKLKEDGFYNKKFFGASLPEAIKYKEDENEDKQPGTYL